MSPAAETGPPPTAEVDTQILTTFLRGGLAVTQDQFHLLEVLSTAPSTEGKVKFNEFTIKKLTDKASPIFFQLGDTINKISADLITGGLTEKKVMEAGQKLEYLEIKLTDVIISSVSLETQKTALPIVDTLFADATKLIQDLMGTEGSSGPATKEHVAIQFAKVDLEFHRIQELAVKGALAVVKAELLPADVFLKVDQVEGRIERLFQKANEAIMDLGDAAASALLPAVQEFHDGILNLLGSLEGGEDFEGGIALPPTDDIIT